ncbi:MAG: D-2-hydroxyacid dehydrogenase [Woeseiaceae bacterium]|nr:D-2-hydroxyacid dehydrogenase [Woeseiaceae bacterium]
MLLFGGAARQFEQPIVERYPDVETVFALPRDIGSVDLAGVSCAVGWRFPGGAFADMPDLRWIQSVSVGVDNWVYDSAIPRDVVITNTKGLYSTEVAEYIIWALLTLSRRFHLATRNQQKRRWRQVAGHSLAGKTIGIAGMGHLGRATATIARALGMRVVGLCRTADDARAAEFADEIVATTALDSALGDLDFLVVCLPLTRETSGMFGREEIARLKPGAIVVNSARSSIVGAQGVVDAVKSGHLAGAALDVFDKEPLSRLSTLWKQQNILVTPHIAAFTKDYKTKVGSRILENIERLREGRPLQGVVNRGKGY